jgi:hypothetical protein
MAHRRISGPGLCGVSVYGLPVEASLEVLTLRADREFAICVEAKLQPYYVRPYAPTCTKTVQVRDLSDHYPVIGRFEYAD